MVPDDVLESEQPTPQPGDDTPESYDDLFGHTIHRSVEAAAIRQLIETQDEVHTPVGRPQDSAEQPADEPETTILPVSHPAVSSPPPAGAELIDQVPWTMSGQNDPRHDAPSAPLASPDDNGLTIDKRSHKALLMEIADSSGTTGSPTSVHAVRCEKGHPNPVHLETCRICRAPLTDQAATTIPRPVLGMLRMSTGDHVLLDRSVLIGRSPTPDRTVNGETPHFVRVPSPSKDISRDHLMIQLDGWHVLITDLESTNGTMVTLPGSAPQRLRPEDPMAIEPGTRVELADDVSFVYEVDT